MGKGHLLLPHKTRVMRPFRCRSVGHMLGRILANMCLVRGVEIKKIPKDLLYVKVDLHRITGVGQGLPFALSKV